MKLMMITGMWHCYQEGVNHNLPSQLQIKVNQVLNSKSTVTTMVTENNNQLKI